MSLIDKFKKVEFNVLDMISKDDITFCEELQKEYDNLYPLAESFDNVVKNFNDCEKESLKERLSYGLKIYNLETDKAKIKLNRIFSGKILIYFEETYKIKFDDIDTKTNMPKPLNWKEISENILITGLNGRSFEEIRLEQLKNDLLNTISYKQVSLKKNKIIIVDFIYFSPPRYSWQTDYETTSYREKMPLLNKALFEFCKCPNIVLSNDYWVSFSNVGNKREFNNEVFKSYKLYKNGKLELEFNNSESAIRFAKEWLNI